MVKIPDLKKDQVSFLAHYKVLDSEIKDSEEFQPTELCFPSSEYSNYTPIESTIYDNGYRAKFEHSTTNETITLRAGNKDHKYITTHLDNYSDINGGDFTQNSKDISDFYAQKNSGGDFSGEYNIIPWQNRLNLKNFTDNILFDLIEKSLSSTTFWDKNNINLDNMGLYNYTKPEDQKINIFSSKVDDPSRELKLAFTNSTSIHKAYLLINSSISNYQGAGIKINDTGAYRISESNYTRGYYYSANDITKVLNDSKELKITQSFNGNAMGESYVATMYVIIIWS